MSFIDRFQVGVSETATIAVSQAMSDAFRELSGDDAPLLRALEGLGATIATEGGHPPLSISSSGLHGGRVRIDAAESSQFATSLLLVSPYAKADVELEVANLGAVGYVDLTLEAMVRWGAQAGRSHSDTGAADAGSAHYIVSAGRHYLGREEVVEYDASAAGHRVRP